MHCFVKRFFFKFVIACPFQESERLRRLVAEAMRSAQAVRELPTESVFVLPDRHDVTALTSLLEKMDENKDTLGIESYGISDTSLEEVSLIPG